MVSPKPAKISETYIKKGEFELPQKLQNLPKELTEPAKAYSKMIKEPVSLKDMYVYKTPEYLMQ